LDELFINQEKNDEIVKELVELDYEDKSDD